jgi:hypothetical protein
MPRVDIAQLTHLILKCVHCGWEHECIKFNDHDSHQVVEIPWRCGGKDHCQWIIPALGFPAVTYKTGWQQAIVEACLLFLNQLPVIRRAELQGTTEADGEHFALPFKIIFAFAD